MDIADPPPTGEGDHPKGGGGAQAVNAALDWTTKLSGNLAAERYIDDKVNR